MFTVIAVLGSLILIAVMTTVEGAFTVVFGWIPFLRRVLPEVKPDSPSVLVGVVALLLFGTGVHWLGRSWRRGASPTGAKWRIQWTVVVILGVVLLFAAGISVIGITHQVAWLATSDQPILGESLRRQDNTEMNLKGIGLGLRNYDDVEQAFPPGGTFSPDGEMLHSWETHILPYIGYSPQGIDMKRPWNSPENQKYFQCVVPDFINPAFRTPPLEDGDGFGLSHFAANSRIMFANKSLKHHEFKHDNANTILVGEVNAGFKPWGHPLNWRDPAAGLNRGASTFGGPTNTGGTTFLMADGSVRFINNAVDPAVLRALSDPRE